MKNETSILHLPLAVVIATKNRADAIKKYALSSLERSEFQDFICIVWDASDNSETKEVAEEIRWPFALHYAKAPRVGLPSQRNDAVGYVLEAHPAVRYVVFIDDDCELSRDALGGMVASFEKSDAAIVNIPMKPLAESTPPSKVQCFLKRCLGMDRHGATSFLYNYGGEDEPAGSDIQWASGGGMGVDVSVFKKHRVFFPEDFQRFGGYALGEDFAFSFFVFKKLKKRIVNSLHGHFLHYAAGSARLDIANMAASKWYNFHLLFDAIYDDVTDLKLLWLKIQFKLFMCAAAAKLLVRARSFDVFSVLKGIGAARTALREFHKDKDIKQLMRPGTPRDTEGLHS